MVGALLSLCFRAVAGPRTLLVLARAPAFVSTIANKMPKRQLYFAPIDLVEDRTRTRVVGVGVMKEVTSGRRVLLRVASGGLADAYVHGD